MKGWELVNFCEFDPYAVKSYCAIHGVSESKNLGDITKIDENRLYPFNMICGGSPCQDFSLAGKLKGSKWICKDCGEEYNPLYVHYTKRDKCPKCGGVHIDKTRSSLLVEWLRIIRANKPNWGLYENVRNIVSKQFKETTFKLFLQELEEYGYNVYWKILNSKDYGIPQNRERLYLVLIRKDLDNGKFNFPQPVPLNLSLRDLLVNDAEEKYYLSNKMVEYIRQSGTKNFYYKPEIDLEVARPLVASRVKMHRASADNYISNSFIENGEKVDITDAKQVLNIKEGKIKVRKLVPLECFRIMGFSDEAYIKARMAGISDTQLYKQAGNSITVDVLYFIYLKIFKAMPYLFEDLKVGSYFSGIGAFEVALDKFFDHIQ